MQVLAKVILEDSEGSKSINLIRDIKDETHLEYEDDEDAKVILDLFEDGIELTRKTKDHSLFLKLRAEANALIESAEGSLQFEVKVLEFKKNDDKLVLCYTVDGSMKTITIVFYRR